jgi:hypothetical protein
MGTAVLTATLLVVERSWDDCALPELSVAEGVDDIVSLTLLLLLVTAGFSAEAGVDVEMSELCHRICIIGASTVKSCTVIWASIELGRIIE